jgi:apolipoprotein N-acyltransferase
MLIRIYRREIILVALFALTHSVIFHRPVFSVLAFVSLIPLLVCLRLCTSRREAFVFGYIAGIATTALTYYWMLHVAVTGFVAICIYLGIYTAIFSALSYEHIQILASVGQAKRKFVAVKILTVSSLWVLIEFIRGNMPVMKFPWALISYSQWKNLNFIQIAEWVGPYGISLVIVLLNLSLFALLLLIHNASRQKVSFLSLIVSLVMMFLCAAPAVANQIYGRVLLEKAQAQLDSGAMTQTRISVIQGNIPQEEKWDDKIQRMILTKYLGLTQQVSLDDPDLVIWPETSFPGFWEYEPEMANRVLLLARSMNTPLLIGAPTYRETHEGVERMNSVIHVSKEGGEINRHHKLRLVPFGEYIPFFKWLRRLFYDIGLFSPGETETIFEYATRGDPARLPEEDGGSPTVKFSTLICFEDIFPDLCRLYVKKGARMLVNVTNDAWFKNTTAPYQHAQSSVFRAVENRVPVVRAANTGLSCFIDITGRVYDSVRIRGKEIMVDGFKTAKVAVSATETFYTRFGDLVVMIAFLLYFFTRILYRKIDN